jgi:hypothetical protein
LNSRTQAGQADFEEIFCLVGTTIFPRESLIEKQSVLLNPAQDDEQFSQGSRFECLFHYRLGGRQLRIRSVP